MTQPFKYPKDFFFFRCHARRPPVGRENDVNSVSVTPDWSGCIVKHASAVIRFGQRSRWNPIWNWQWYQVRTDGIISHVPDVI